MGKKHKKTGDSKLKRRAKALLFVLFILICDVILVVIGINIYVRFYADDYIYENVSEIEGNMDAIIVLGAGLNQDQSPGTVLRDRLDTAIKLYKDGVSDRLLMSGDHGDTYHNEVKAMKEYAIDQGVPADDIFMDHAGFTTYETMVRARDIFQVKKAVIVTQEYHLFRSVYIARRLGLDAYGYPSDIEIDRSNVFLEIREIFARVKAAIYMIFTPEPTYRGEVIPISGSGAQTDD